MKRIYYKFPDGREMLEDWKVSNTKARELLGRYWLRKSVMGKQLHWDIEFGEDSHLQALKSSHRQSHATPEELLIAQNNSNVRYSLDFKHSMKRADFVQNVAL